MDAASDLAGALHRVGARTGEPLALVVVPGLGAGLAAAGGPLPLPGEPADLVRRVERGLAPRWTWWSAAGTAAPLVAAGVHLARCHDVAAVHRLLVGGSRDDPAAAWAAAHDLPEPPPPAQHREAAHGTGLLDLDGTLAGDAGPVDEHGQLSAGWVQGRAFGPDAEPAERLRRAARWAVLALHTAAGQQRALDARPDPRPHPAPPPLPVQTAWSESAAALLAVELERTGLPLDRAVAEAVVVAEVGPRPDGPAAEAAARAARDAPVRELLGPVDLRNPAQVLAALRQLGFDVPDTRAWRLERLRGSHPVVEALLRWRRAERLATTYGHGWLAHHVGADGRLRGAWSASDGGGGRMTAQAGLHNLPAELRPAVAAERGHVLVRADLGQVEPRVLAVLSGDAGLAAATRDDDLYAPVAAALGADRATAKVAVLAAMYGQTSGAAGEALRRMERAYPAALAFLRAAEEAGRAGRDVATWGGRPVRVGSADLPEEARAVRGRFARNAVVQGTAAELFKAWAASVRAGLADAGGGGRVVLCLHDELLLHVPEQDAGAAADLLRSALARTARRWAGGEVRFVADVAVVRRWSEAK
ncbi:DNA polymerase [Kineococcus arenarius]|uniref:DNA polymerase n=1 Tax=Kineococcus sp. SYSU DK007 TaxID=3383128 RepID=UPI003D7E25F9